MKTGKMIACAMLLCMATTTRAQEFRIGLFGKSRLTTELNGTTTTTTAATNVFDAMRRVDCGVGLRYDISMIVFLGGKNWSEVNFCLSLSRNCTNKGHGNVYKRRKCRIPVLPQQRVRR